MILMVLFPIVLMLVLGTALSGFFDNSSAFKDIKVIYADRAAQPLSLAFQGFMEKGREMGIEFTVAGSAGQGIDSVKDGKYACFIEVSESGIELYKNSGSFKADLVEAALNSFLQRYNVMAGIARVNPAAAGKIMAGGNNGAVDYVKVSSPGNNRQPGAMDYYAVTMLTLIIMYAAISGAFAIKNERTAKTADRLLCSPAGKHEILTGKTLGVLLVTFLQVLVVIVFSKYVLGANWGSHMGTVLLLVAAEVVMAVSLGLGLALIIRSEATVMGFLNLIIPLIVFLGGGYVPIEGFNKTLLYLSGLSPLRWVNKSIFQVIYSNDFSSVAPAIGINLGLAVLFLAISSFVVKKEAFR